MIVAVPMPPPMHKGDERRALAGALEFVERGAEDHRAGRAERMAHGDRAAVDVDLARVDVERLQKRSTTEAKASLTSKRSMSSMLMPERASTFLVTSTGPVSMIAGSEPILAKARMRPRGLRSRLCAGFARADQHRGRAVDDARRIAGVVDMDDALDLRMRLDRDRVEAALLAQQ